MKAKQGKLVKMSGSYDQKFDKKVREVRPGWFESKGTLAAKKAWKTMKDREALMTPKELKELAAKRSRAAQKAWDTIRKNNGV